MDTMLRERRELATLEADPYEALRKLLRQELSHLDAVIRFNIERRNKLERQLRDLEPER